jgi:predicted RNase H-like nuclease (RuvC/YqgF family)
MRGSWMCNNLGEVRCVKYTTATPRVSLEGIHASQSQVKFIPPREAPKRSAHAPLEREAKHPRTTIAMLETKVDTLTKAVTLITSTVHTLSRQMEMNMLEISNLKKENERLVREMDKKETERIMREMFYKDVGKN